MSIGRDAVLTPKASVILVLAWSAFVAAMFAPNWHPLTLMSRMLPVIPQDVAAGIVRLLRYGVADLAMLALIICSAFGFGGLLLRYFRVETDGGASRTLSFGLGLAALSYLTLFVGLAGRYDAAGRVVLLAVLTLTAVYGAFLAVKSARGIRGNYRAGWPDIAFFVVLALVSLFLAAKALRPAVFYDAVTYHLGAPNYYLLEGGISYIPFDSYSNFPFAAEMLYTLGMFVSGLGLAQLTSVAVFIAFTMLVYEFTRSFLPDVPPALPAVFCLLTPAFMENAVQFSNDLFLAYCSLMAVYCFFMLERRGGAGWAALTGVFTGVCIGTKYIALVSITAPAFLAVCYIAYKNRAKGWRSALKTVFMFALPAAAVASPWLIKNWYFTGNPFYPAFFGIFGGRDMTAGYYAVHAMNHPSTIDGVKGIFTHPWKLFMESPAYLTAKYRAASFLGPAVLLFAPLLLWVRGVDPVIKKLCVYAALLFVMWSMAFPLTRYLYPAIAALLIISAYAAARTYRFFAVPGKAVLVTAASACLAFNLCLGFFLVDQWTNAYGFDHLYETDGEYLARRAGDGGAVMLHSLPVYEFINGNAGGDARVLIIGDAQHLYIKRRHLYAYLSAKNPYGVFSGEAADAGVIEKRLKSEGVTHIVYNPLELERLERGGYTSFPEKDNGNIERFLGSAYVKPLIRADVPGRPVYLFELK